MAGAGKIVGDIVSPASDECVLPAVGYRSVQAGSSDPDHSIRPSESADNRSGSIYSRLPLPSPEPEPPLSMFAIE